MCIVDIHTPPHTPHQHTFHQHTPHQATHRWDDFSEEEHRELLSIALAQLQRVASSADAWPLKSRSALLLATLLKRQGAAALQGVLTQLLTFAQGGAVQTEMVCDYGVCEEWGWACMWVVRGAAVKKDCHAHLFHAHLLHAYLFHKHNPSIYPPPPIAIHTTHHHPPSPPITTHHHPPYPPPPTGMHGLAISCRRSHPIL